MARILILTHEFAPFRGGIAAVAEGLAAGASANGHEPIVLAPDYHKAANALNTRSDYEVLRFPGATCPIVSFDRLVRFANVCRRTIRAVRPDVVHAADPPAQMALTALSRLRLVRDYFFTVHGTELLRYRREGLPRLWMAGAFRRVKRVAAVSHAVLRIALDELALPAAHGFVAHPAVAALWHEAPIADRAALRNRWRVDAADIVLLTTARVVPDKGHADVIAAVAKLAEAMRRRLVYVVVGKAAPSYAQTLVQAAAAVGLRLILTGETSDEEAVAVTDAADLFVMPSRRTAKRLEGFGIAYIEAGARGLPSIARATGGVAEAVHDGETGIVIAETPGTHELAGALQRLIEAPDLRKRMGLRAREHARAFTWQRHARSVYDGFGIDDPG